VAVKHGPTINHALLGSVDVISEQYFVFLSRGLFANGPNIKKQTSIPLPCFFFVHQALLPSMGQYRALDKHFSQYLWTIIAPSNLNSASIVAICPQLMQKPVDFFVVCDAGLV
jgi:hypothetical protein